MMVLSKREQRQREQATHRREEVEAWWALIARVLAFIAGIILISVNVYVMDGDAPEVRLAFLFAAVAMIGPVVAASLAEILRGARGEAASD